MAFASLGSGSRGNGTLVRLGSQLLLVDCGFTVKQAERRMARLGVRPGDLDAILVTHEHADHVGGVAQLAHKYAVPVFASYGTLRSSRDLIGQPFDGDVQFSIGEVTVDPVRVPHDAREPTQFVFSHGAEKVGVLSDLGTVTPHVVRQFSGCTELLMEANHDRGMLLRGSYPQRLKRRIASDHGHLSNEQAHALLARLAHPQLTVVIGHTSEENNDRDELRGQFAALAGRVGALGYATQDDGVEWQGEAAHAPAASRAQAELLATPSGELA